MRVAFHETDGKHENDENDEDTVLTEMITI